MRRAIRVLDLISVDGAGGGAEKIVLRTAARANRGRFASTMCCLRCADDSVYDMDVRARELGIDYCEAVTRSKFDRNVFPALRRIVRDRQIDIVHAHGYKSAFFAWRLGRAEGVIPLSTSHGWTGHHWRERFLYYPADRLIIGTFPLAVAVSEEIRDVLIRCGCKAERIRVIHNGIDPDEFVPSPEIRGRVRQQLGVQAGEIVIGAAGRLEPQKRFDVLIETTKVLLQRGRRVRLFIAGVGSLQAALEKKILSLGIAGVCQLLGHRADIKDVYQGFDVLVQSSDYEGTPTVIVEAMALHVPIVATDAGGTTEIAENNRHALIVPRRDPTALANAVEKALDDPAATARRVAAARQAVETKLSFDARTSKLESVYEEITTADRCGCPRGADEEILSGI